MAKIAVIVPVYKVENYLYRCIDSILGQSFSDFNLVLVDDGSPDNCGLICDDYAGKDARIHVIHQENAGLSAARNAGIDWVFSESDSEWLTFIDSDDWIHNGYLQMLLDAAESCGTKLSACGFYKTTGAEFPDMEMKAPVLLSADEYYCNAPVDEAPAPACGKLYCRSLFQSLRFPEGKLHEDEFTTYKTVYAAGCVAKVREKLYAYYTNPDSITKSCWKPGRLDALEAFQQQMDFAEKTGNDQLRKKATDAYVWAAALQAQQLSSQLKDNPENKPYLDMLRRRIRSILRHGMNGKTYPLSRENLLLYEMAYPVRPVWNLMHISYSLVKKLLGRE